MPYFCSKNVNLVILVILDDVFVEFVFVLPTTSLPHWCVVIIFFSDIVLILRSRLRTVHKPPSTHHWPGNLRNHGVLRKWPLASPISLQRPYQAHRCHRHTMGNHPCAWLGPSPLDALHVRSCTVLRKVLDFSTTTIYNYITPDSPSFISFSAPNTPALLPISSANAGLALSRVSASRIVFTASHSSSVRSRIAPTAFIF